MKLIIQYSALFLLMGIVLFTTTLSAQKKVRATDDSRMREAEYYFTEGEKYYILEDYAKALVFYQKALDINKDNATIHYKIATVYAEGDELDKANIAISQALSLDDSNKYFYLLKANIATQKGNYKEAAETYENLISKIEKTDIYLYELAAIYLYQQDFDQALKTYDRVEQAFGMAEEITRQKQKIYLQLNELDKAIDEGKKLIEAFPEEERHVVNLAKIYISNSREQEAMDLISDFLNEVPDAYQSRMTLAELKRRNGDVKGAMNDLTVLFRQKSANPSTKVQLLAEYRQLLSDTELKEFGLPLVEILIELHEDVADVHIIYADILQQLGQSENALKEYIASTEINASNIAVWQNIIQLSFELEQFETAIKMSEKALEYFPNQGFLYYYNGAANMQAGNNADAIIMLEQGKRISSSNLDLVSGFNAMLGDAYYNAKDYEKSDRAYDAALDHDPDNDLVLNNYSYFLSERNEKLDKAEIMSAKVIEKNPQNVTYLDTYAWVLYKKGKYKEAKKVMETAFEIGGVEGIHYSHYGDILFKMGKVEKAIEQWKIALEMDNSISNLSKKINDKKLYEE